MPVSIPKGHLFRWLLLLLITATGFTIFWLIKRGIGAGDRSAAAMHKRELAALQGLASKLADLGQENKAPRVVVVLSKKSIDAMLAKFKDGMVVVPPSVSSPELRFKFGQITSTFKMGFPELNVTFTEVTVGLATGNNFKVIGALEPIVEDGKARLRITLTDIETATLASLPTPVRDAVLGHALQGLNRHIPVMDIPVQSSLDLPHIPIAAVPVTVSVPSGSIALALQPPAILPMSRHLRFQAIFFNAESLVVVADLLQQPPAEQKLPQTAATAGNVSEAELKEARENVIALLNAPAWKALRAPGNDYRVQVNTALLQEVIQEVGLWPESNRTLMVRSTGSTGDIFAKTGGLPFGNGFKVYLEHPDSVQGRAMLAAPKLTTAENAYDLQGDIALTAQVQIHAHGNAPQVTKRIFGVKIIDVKVGGGAGTNIGLNLTKPRFVNGVTLRIKPSVKEGQPGLGLTLKTPSDILVSVEGGGIPGWVEKHFMSNIRVPLPTDRELAWIPLPRLLVPSIPHPVKPGTNLTLKSEPVIQLLPGSIDVTGSLTVSESP